MNELSPGLADASYLDLGIAAVLLLSAAMSAARGFSVELLTALAWIVGLAVAWQFAGAAAALFPASFDAVELGGQRFSVVEYHKPLAGLLLFLLVFLVAGLLQRSREGKKTLRGDHLLGFLFGLARGGLLVLALTLVAGTTAFPASDLWQRSLLPPYFVAAAEPLVSLMPEQWQTFFHYPQPLPEA